MSKAADDRQAVHARLLEALAAWGGGRSAFVEAVGRELGEGRGSSRFQLLRYINGQGKYAPPVHFLNAAANVLGVRAGWLAFGEGERTAAEEAAAAKVEPIPLLALVEAGVTREFRGFARATWLDRAILLNEAQNLMGHLRGSKEEAATQAGQRIGRALQGLWDTVTGGDSDSEPDAGGQFIRAAVEAIAAVVREWDGEAEEGWEEEWKSPFDYPDDDEEEDDDAEA